ncbi:MAG TPA: peptide deformylase, partial [Thermoanaerobaculia bacterium]|nr:peptide deformylase [Thermoanaerobaculia bacterium]
MSILPIRLYPDPVLRAHCREVEEFDAELVRLVADMVETMHAAPG